MFKKKLIFILISLSVIILFQSCRFNAAKKIQDPKKKYTKALDYYEEGKYAKTTILLESVILSLRMTTEGEDALYKFADSYYHMKNYILAGYYFRKYAKDYPNSENAEEAQFMSAKCFYLDAPKTKLDQQATLTALQEFELFITKYPESKKINECNKYVDILRDKLEIKSYENAKLYYDIGYYNAAAIALKNSIRDFPDTKFKEDIYYYITLSKYEYAKNSIKTKQQERYEDVITAYDKLIEKYPNSKYIKEAKNVYSYAKKQITKKEKNI